MININENRNLIGTTEKISYIKNNYDYYINVHRLFSYGTTEELSKYKSANKRILAVSNDNTDVIIKEYEQDEISEFYKKSGDSWSRVYCKNINVGDVVFITIFNSTNHKYYNQWLKILTKTTIDSSSNIFNITSNNLALTPAELDIDYISCGNTSSTQVYFFREYKTGFMIDPEYIKSTLKLNWWLEATSLDKYYINSNFAIDIGDLMPIDESLDRENLTRFEALYLTKCFLPYNRDINKKLLSDISIYQNRFDSSIIAALSINKMLYTTQPYTYNVNESFEINGTFPVINSTNADYIAPNTTGNFELVKIKKQFQIFPSKLSSAPTLILDKTGPNKISFFLAMVGGGGGGRRSNGGGASGGAAFALVRYSPEYLYNLTVGKGGSRGDNTASSTGSDGGTSRLRIYNISSEKYTFLDAYGGGRSKKTR